MGGGFMGGGGGGGGGGGRGTQPPSEEAITTLMVRVCTVLLLFHRCSGFVDFTTLLSCFLFFKNCLGCWFVCCDNRVWDLIDPL